MLETLLQPFNTPFLYAFYALLFFLAIELLSLIAGLGLSEIIDNALDGSEVGIETDTDFDTEGGSFISKYFSWIKVKNVPLLVLIILFLCFFSVSGIAIQSILNQYFGFTMKSLFSIPVAMIAGFPLYKTCAEFLGRKVFKEESTAILEASLLGKHAEITIGTSKIGFPAEAKVRDEHGQLHYVMVEPVSKKESYTQGDRVLLESKNEHIFKATLDNSNQTS